MEPSALFARIFKSIGPKLDPQTISNRPRTPRKFIFLAAGTTDLFSKSENEPDFVQNQSGCGSVHIVRSLRLRKLAEQCLISPKPRSKLEIRAENRNFALGEKSPFLAPGDKSGAQNIPNYVHGGHLQEKPPGKSTHGPSSRKQVPYTSDQGPALRSIEEGLKAPP